MFWGYQLQDRAKPGLIAPDICSKLAVDVAIPVAFIHLKPCVCMFAQESNPVVPNPARVQMVTQS